jgi:large subunit ribosomal protein L21
MYAVIRTGGKQYRVTPGDVLDVERLKVAVGDTVSLPALLVVDEGAVRARPQELEGTAVRAEVVGHKRGRKIRVFNYHAKTGWKRMKGHRQELTTVRITTIGDGHGAAGPEPASEDRSEERTSGA